MAGLYIHIPFCARRCIYCGFYSTTLLHLRQQYVDALCREMQMRGPSTIQTVYLGGGTPSQLSGEMLQQLFDAIATDLEIEFAKAEVTMECNPDDINRDYVRNIISTPVNRVSLGVQSFNDERLHFLNRRHSAAQARKAVKTLREAGIQNISIDLMFGLPGQTVQELHQDVEEALSLDVEHISVYGLMFEDGTPLKRMLDDGDISETDDDTYIIMYNTMTDMLEAAGYDHYEISNFAKSGFRSRHNSSYWDNTPYIGIGAGAHSYDGATRQSNIDDIQQYIDSISRKFIPCEREVLTQKDHYNDYITTAMRTRDGVQLSKLLEEYGKDWLDYMLNFAQPHINNGLLELENGHLHLTRKGITLSNSVMSDMIML